MKTLLILAALVATPAIAQTQRAITAGSGRSYAQADAALNAAYRAAMGRMKAMDADPDPGPRPNPNYQGALLAAQRAWLVFRDAECRVEGYENFGGTMQSMAILDCRTELTRLRTRQLAQVQQPQ